MKPSLRLHLLGRPEAHFDGRRVKWSALPRCYSVLALLAAKSDVPFTRASLAASVWPDELDNEARANLRRHLHSLQRVLPAIDGIDWVVSDDRTIAWNDAAPAWIDVRAFEEAAADPSRAEEAIEAYRGDLLEGYYDDCVMAERERLRDIYLKLLARLITDARDARDFASAIRYADKLLAADEWREDAVRAWIACTYEAGDRSGALAAYERFARRLREEFSAEPMAETTALRDAIRAGVALPQGPHAPFLSERSESATRAWRLPFVGRAEAFEKLRAAWSRAARRTGSVAFVSGEAGIGKSRLVSEIAALVTEQGGHVLVGHTSNPETEPYQAFVTALRPALPGIVASAGVDRALLSAAAGVFPEITELQPSLAATEELPPERARERLYEAFVRLVEQASKIRPLCLVLEDVHWARAAALDLLGVLARRVGTLPILIVVTYRSEESTAGHPLRALRSALVAERRAISVSLGRLAPPDVAAVVELVAGAAAPKLASEIARLSEGNPLFVAQLLESYHETGAVPDASSALRTIGDAIDARVRAFDPAVRAVAEVAATLGEFFRADYVADIGGWHENDAFDAFGTLIDRGLVREAGSGSLEYVFTHALVAASFYQAAPAEVRALRHRRAAQLLERISVDDRVAIARIARHWKLAGEGDRAGVAYGRAARAALDVHAREATIEFAREALACGPEPRARFDLLHVLIRAQEHSDRLEEWNLDLAAFEEVARQLDDAARYEALTARERYYAQTGDREAQLRLIDDMLALAREAGSNPWLAQANVALGLLHVGLGRFAEAVDDFRCALALAPEDRRLISSARRSLVQAMTRAGDFTGAAAELDVHRRYVGAGASLEERLDLMWAESAVALHTENADVLARIGGEMLDLAMAAGDQETMAKAYWLRAWAANVRRDTAGVRSNYGEAAALFERIRQPQSLAATYVNLGVYDLEMGFVDRAVENWERGAALAEATGTTNVLGFALANMADALLAKGDLDEAFQYAERASAVGVPTGDHRLIATTTGTLGEIACARGDFETGLPMLRDAIAMWRASDAHQSLVEELRRLITALLLRGSNANRAELDAAAAELTALYDERPDEQKTPVRVLLTLANNARARGDESEAASYEDRARAAFEAELARISDEESRTAFLSLAYHREFANVPTAAVAKAARRKR